MGMYTELVLGVEIYENENVIGILRYMLGETDWFDGDYSHSLFDSERWHWMLQCDSYYFAGTTHSELVVKDFVYEKAYYLTIRCNLKNYNDEIEQFIDWLNPYIKTQGFLGYHRYEEFEDPTLIYKDGEDIIYQ